MDETCLSQGELYTIVTNKSAHGGKGALIAMIKGTKSEEVVHYMSKLPRSLRLKVKEITIDLSPTMKLIAKRTFPNATIVSDRFHVQKLMNEAISDLRVDYRWRLLTRRMPRWSWLVKLGGSLGHTLFPTETLAVNCLLVVDISWWRTARSGQTLSEYGLRYFLSNTLFWVRLTKFRWL